MRIGIDLHGVLDKNVALMRALLVALTGTGKVQIMIITGPPYHEALHELDELGYQMGTDYHGLVSVVDFLRNTGEVDMRQDQDGHWWCDDKDWWSSKAKICDKYKLDIMIDNEKRYQQYFTNWCRFILV